MAIPQFTLKTEYFCSVPVEFTHPASVSGITGMLYHVEHPAFQALKDHLENFGFIKVDEMGCYNRDLVLKQFKLNNRIYNVNDRFTCADNQGIIEKMESETKGMDKETNI